MAENKPSLDQGLLGIALEQQCQTLPGDWRYSLYTGGVLVRWRYYDISETTTIGYYQSTTIPAGFLRNQHTGKCLDIEEHDHIDHTQSTCTLGWRRNQMQWP
eukprot:5000990-Amphidinium_carterae.1